MSRIGRSQIILEVLNMRIGASLMAVCLLVLMAAQIGCASMDQFAGRWTNADTNTGGMTTLQIGVSGDSADVHAWGKCHPSDCDWGSVSFNAFAPDVSSDLASKAIALMGVFDAGFSETTVIIKPSGSQLSVQSFTRFKDNSGRSNYVSNYIFQKSLNFSKIKPILLNPIKIPLQVGKQ